MSIMSNHAIEFIIHEGKTELRITPSGGTASLSFLLTDDELENVLRNGLRAFNNRTSKSEAKQ